MLALHDGPARCGGDYAFAAVCFVLLLNQVQIALCDVLEGALVLCYRSTNVSGAEITLVRLALDGQGACIHIARLKQRLTAFGGVCALLQD